MKRKIGLASGWRLLCALVCISSSYLFMKSTIAYSYLLDSLLQTDVLIFKLVGVLITSGVFLFLLFFSGFLAWFFLYKFLRENLVLTDTSIEHHTFGYTLQSNWLDTKKILSVGALGQINGIYVTPAQITPWNKLPIRWFVNINSQGEYFIPLSMFDVNWRDSELGQQIKQHAPHLFENKQSV